LSTATRLLQDCDPMLPTKILLLTRIILKTFQAKRRMLYYAFGLVILCLAMLLLTQYAPKTRI